MRILIPLARQLRGSEPKFTRLNLRTLAGSGGLLLLLATTGLLLSGCAAQTPRHSGVLKVSTEICPYKIHPLDRGELTFADGSIKELIVTHEGTVDVTSGTQKVEGMPVTDFKD